MGSKITYPREMRETKHGKRLYGAWKRMKAHPHAAEFADFADFHNWAIYNGYSMGARLHRIDDEKPYSPENCEWRFQNEDRLKLQAIEKMKQPVVQVRVMEWNRAVNRIRVYFGMEPFPENIPTDVPDTDVGNKEVVGL